MSQSCSGLLHQPPDKRLKAAVCRMRIVVMTLYMGCWRVVGRKRQSAFHVFCFNGRESFDKSKFLFTFFLDFLNLGLYGGGKWFKVDANNGS